MAYHIDIPWEPPRGLAMDVPFLVRFEIVSESGDYEPDERMYQLWAKYRRHHAEHVKEFAERLVDLYRGTTCLPGDYSDDLPKREILKLTKGATIIVNRTESQGEQLYSLEVRFELEWDDEHGYALPFDEDTETFGAWQD